MCAVRRRGSGREKQVEGCLTKTWNNRDYFFQIFSRGEEAPGI